MSFVRTFDWRPSCYQELLDSFRSKGLDLGKLNKLWHKLFNPLRVNGRLVFACDGINAPKEGRLMPSVKLCHPEAGALIIIKMFAEDRLKPFKLLNSSMETPS